jgi:hypothetical protein
MSALCCETCLNYFKQMWGNLLQFALPNAVNCFTNILFQSLQVMRIVGIHNTFELSPRIKVTGVRSGDLGGHRPLLIILSSPFISPNTRRNARMVSLAVCVESYTKYPNISSASFVLLPLHTRAVLRT